MTWPSSAGRSRAWTARCATSSTRQRPHRGTCARAADIGIDVAGARPPPPPGHPQRRQRAQRAGRRRTGSVTGLIDFGDVVCTARVCGLAVAGAYAMQGAAGPGARGRAAGARLPRGRAAARGRARGAVRADARAAGAERRDGGAPARRGAGQRLPADQPGGRDARCSRGSTARTPTLAHFRFRDACGYEASPNARRVRQFLARTTCAPRDGGRPGRGARCSTWARRCRRSTGSRSAATTRSARSTPRPSSRRRTGAGARGTWRSTCSRPPGTPVYAPLDGVVERAREPRTGSATTAGCSCSRHDGLLDAARASRSRDRSRRARCARARRSRGSARRRSTAAGSRTCTCSCSPTW